MRPTWIAAGCWALMWTGCGGGAIQDADGDGQLAPEHGGIDCDDQDPEVFSGTAEVCGDGIDNNCDGLVDNAGVGAVTWYQDFDGDGFGVAEVTEAACAGSRTGLGWAPIAGDCDDSDGDMHPAAADDECDRIDQDCDGEADDGAPIATWYADLDGDGFGDASSPVEDCRPPIGAVANAEDCDDDDDDAHPNAAELECTGVDENCDGEVDEGSPLTTFFEDFDGDGLGSAKKPVVAACDPPAGAVANAADCHDGDAAVADVCVPRIRMDGTDYATLADAVAAASAAKTGVVQLDPGLYTVTSQVDTFESGTEITIEGSIHGDAVVQNTGTGPAFRVTGFPILPTFSNLVFHGPNRAIRGSTSSDFVVRDSRFENHTSNDRGSAILHDSGRMTLERVEFVNTFSVDNGGAVSQGEVELWASRATLTDVTFTDTQSNGHGGGLALFNSLFTCTRCVFDNTVAGGDGGAIHAENLSFNRTFTLLDSQFTETRATSGGAVAVLGADEVIITGNRFHTPLATGVGGAVWAQGDQSTLFNNLFCDAQASSGSAVELIDGVWEVVNNSVVGAVSGSLGGIVSLPTASARFENNLFYELPVHALYFYEPFSSEAIEYNAFFGNSSNVEGASLGVGNLLGKAPLLVAWSDDGDCSNDDLRPGWGSPLVDAGDPTRADADGSVSDIGFTGGPDAPEQVDADLDGVPAYLDCNDGSAIANPGAAEICNGLDDNCDGSVDEGLATYVYYIDEDGDGVGGSIQVDLCFETARTGFSADSGDCNDRDAAVHPGAAEICNRIDDDCDGLHDHLDADAVGVLLRYSDLDGDGFGACVGEDCLPMAVCESDVRAFHTIDGGDCDDTHQGVNPLAQEIIDNGIDDDCDGHESLGDSSLPVVSAGCGCASTTRGAGGLGGAFPWLAGLWLLLARRRA